MTSNWTQRGLSAIAAILLASITGCNTYTPTTNTVEIPSSGGSKVDVTDTKLASIASVKRVNKTRAGDRLHVQIDLANETGDPHEIMYRFVWRDANGIELSTSMSTWIRHRLQPRQTSSLQGVAPYAEATDVKFEMIRSQTDYKDQ